MKNNRLLLLLVGLLFVGAAMAQQDPNYTFYRYNMNLINPAYAGANGTELGLSIRSQWANVDGAPETQSLFFSTNTGKKVGLGVSLVNDKTFIESSTTIAVDFSYNLNFSEGVDLYLGLKAGMNQYKANLAGLSTSGTAFDPNLGDINGGFNPNVGIGALLQVQKLFVSLSVPRVLSPDRLESADGMVRFGEDKLHMYASTGYDFEVNENLILKPSVLFTYVAASPLSIDLTGLVEIHERIELGVSYRVNEGVGGLFIFKTNALNIGYAYETATDNPLDYAGDGTHELFLKINLK